MDSCVCVRPTKLRLGEISNISWLYSVILHGIIQYFHSNLNNLCHRAGICIWSASYPGNAALVRSGVTASSGTVSRGSGARWTLVDFLQSPNGEQITALCWNPDGRYP